MTVHVAMESAAHSCELGAACLGFGVQAAHAACLGFGVQTAHARELVCLGRGIG